MRAAWAYVWFVVGLLFVGFWSYGLFDLDEGIYAAALTEMAKKGEWINISFQGQPFFEKPILIYWCGLLLTKIGIPGVAALRLFSVLAALGTLASVGAFCKRYFDSRVAIGSVLLLGTSILFAMMGRMFTPDSLLTFAITGAMFSYWEALHGSKRWLLATGLLLGIGVLAKGPMPVFVFAVVAIYVAFGQRKSGAKFTTWLMPLVIFVATLATWYVPVLLQSGPAFFGEFIVKQNLGRFGGGDIAHLGPVYYYVPIALLSFIPASLVMPWAWMRVRQQPVEKFLWAWVITVFVLFSVAGTKLPHYILPMLPPLAILTARALLTAPKGYQIAMLVFAAILTCGSWYATTLNDDIAKATAIPLAIAATVGFAASMYAYLSKRGQLAQALGVAFPVCAAGMLIVVPTYWSHAYDDVAKIGTSLARIDGEVIEYRTGAEGKPRETGHPSIIWIANRVTTPAKNVDDLARLAEPGGYILSRENRMEGAQEILARRGISLQRVESIGRFQLYKVDAIPK